MIRVLLLFTTICYSSLLSAQTISAFRIDYVIKVDPKLLELNAETEKDPVKKELAATAALLSVFQNGDSPIAQTWTSKDFVRADNTLLGESYQIVNKKTKESHQIYPSLEQYVPTNTDETFTFYGDSPVELIPNQEKTIAGYKCKLAKITLDTEEVLPAEIEIWYTEKIPVAYWGEYSYLSKLPGAALAISTLGLGIEASAVTPESQSELFFSIPENYVEMDEASSFGYNDYEIGENKNVFLDTTTSLYGIKDSIGTIIIQPEYSIINSFANGQILAANNEHLWGTMDENGKAIIPFQYEYLSHDDENDLYMYSENSLYGYLDDKGKVVIPATYESLGSFSEGYATFIKNEKTGIIDKSEKLIIPATYDYIVEHGKNFFITIENDTLYNLYDINTNKKIVADLEYATLSGAENIIIGIKNGKYGFIDITGKIIIPFQYYYASSFENGIASVIKNESDLTTTYINTQGNEVAPPAEDQ